MTVIHMDCLEGLRILADNSVDSIVTDPPYGLRFMGRRWDYDVPSVEIWAECLRVLKPGGHLLAFAGTRTQHRMAVRIEDAGFEIRDLIAWVYGSGFPKSLDVSKAMGKAAGHVRERVPGGQQGKNAVLGARKPGEAVSDEAIGADAARWRGWGTALKPALEPITVARKPLAGTVAETVVAYGTGAINIDGCRVPTDDGYTGNAVTQGVNTAQTSYELWRERRTFEPAQAGRWPANLLHDGSDEVDEAFGVASRFFYCAKASRSDRNEGCEHLPRRPLNWSSGDANPGSFQSEGTDKSSPNHHPTVKPTDLMRYLCRLVTPPGGLIVDPFAGSGSTGKAAVLEGFEFIGFEREAEFVEIATARIDAAGNSALPSTARNIRTP